MKALERLFGKRKDTSSEDKKEETVGKVWRLVGGLLEGKSSASFDVDKKIKEENLPPDLRQWNYIDSISEPFNVSVNGTFGRALTLTHGSRYVKLTVRGPGDLKPTLEEGTIIDTKRVSFSQQPQRDPLTFALNLSRFAVLHSDSKRRSSQ